MRALRMAIDDARWSEYAVSHPDSTPFHLPAWTKVIAGCYGFDSFALAVDGGDGQIVGGLPVVEFRSPLGMRRWASLPFTDYCPVLVDSNVDADAVMGAIVGFVADSTPHTLELRSEVAGVPDVKSVQVGYRHVLRIPESPDDLHPNKGHRYSKNRAIRKGVTVRQTTSAEALDTFYALHTLTRRRHGVPVQPRRLFDLLWERMIVPGNGVISVASVDGVDHAAAIYLMHNKTMIAKYHASDPSLPDMGAGYLIDWDSMLSACANGYTELDMGRSDFGADGLRLYKSSWGATELPLVYSQLASTRATRPQMRQHGLSKTIIRNSPLWFCRLAGKLLYRWAA